VTTLTKIAIVLFTVALSVLSGQTQDANRAIAMPVQPAYVPMDAHQRLNTYLKDLVSPVSFLRSGASAGFGQWRDRPKEWGEGGRGFGKRFASAYAQHIATATLIYGAGSILHEDNRYLRMAEGDKKNRLAYALESSVLARHDDGTRHVSISKLVAVTGAAFIARSWQPHDSRTVKGALESVAVTMSVSAGFDVMREFLPDLFHRK
jgi:hypothetical protein